MAQYRRSCPVRPPPWPRCTPRPDRSSRAAHPRCTRDWPPCTAIRVVINKWASWCVPCQSRARRLPAWPPAATGTRSRSSASTQATRARRRTRKFLRALPGQLPELLRLERALGRADRPTPRSRRSRSSRRARAAVHLPGSVPERREARSRRPPLRAGLADLSPRSDARDPDRPAERAPGRSSRASARARPGGEPRCRAAGADRCANATRSRRATRTARRLSSTRCGPTAARRRAGLDGAGGAQPVPGAVARLRAPERARRPAGPVLARPARGRARGDRQRARVGALAGRAAAERLVAAMEVWRERMRVHGERSPTCS